MSAMRGSTPTLPPVVSSMRLPCVFILSEQQTSSVAIVCSVPSAVPAHSVLRSLSDLSDGYV
jgi:hypothetical protein